MIEAVSNLKIHLIEDNQELCVWLEKALSSHDHEVHCSLDGLLAMDLQNREIFDVIVLDLQLPGLSGKNIIQRLRAKNDKTPILVLTANSALFTKIESLDFGADDFLAKPFEIEELLARLRALYRRSGKDGGGEINCAQLSYNKDTLLFKINNEVLLLSPREHDVLLALMQRQGETLSKKVIANLVSKDHELITDDAIEIYIHRLRKKIESSGCVIGTLRGLGYILNKQ
jgi:DNA-binding response OmpR family regulator